MTKFNEVDMKEIRIATRPSRLAMVQSEYIKSLLEKLDADVQVSLVRISTRGDRDKSDFLYKSESVGFFTSEVENALIDGRADLAVHSFKDLPTAYAKQLTVAAVPKRESVADALVAGAGGDLADAGLYIASQGHATQVVADMLQLPDASQAGGPHRCTCGQVRDGLYIGAGHQRIGDGFSFGYGGDGQLFGVGGGQVLEAVD
ncbi:MAG: hypothetical protein DRP66_08035, partial [Planctomycetota bacterium]